MAVASVNALVLSLVQEKSNYEQERMVIDQRRTMLALYAGNLSTEYQAKLAKQVSINEDVDEDDQDTVTDLNDSEFAVEYAAAQQKIESQDKVLEMQRTNLDTKIEAITTHLESAEKRLETNTEKEFKTLGGN